MADKNKIDKIKNLPKEDDIHELLMDLLPKMGFQDVTLTHERGNMPEYGKDIIASQYDRIENKKDWIAFVVKKGDVAGTSKGTEEIKAQIAECFDFSWNSITKGRDIMVNKVKVVINGKFNSGAKDKILKSDFYKNPNISFWSYQELVDFIDDKYPKYWLKGSRSYKNYIDAFQKNNEDDLLINSLGVKNDKLKKIVNFAIKPKFIELKTQVSGEVKTKIYDISDLEKLTECSLIVGESGSGKTTFFKQIANDIVYQNSIRNDYELYPIILKFQDLQKHDYNILDFLKFEFEQGKYKGLGVEVDRLLTLKNYCLFIDALDELGDDSRKQTALESLGEFIEANPEVKIFCTSRPADSLLSKCTSLNFRYFEIANVSYKQAEQFIGRYFNEEEIKCKRLLKSLKDSRILEKLPKTPLTLALVTAIFDESEIEIPSTISDLYKYFVELLLSKSLLNSTTDLLKIGVHRAALSYLAEHLHFKKSTTIEKSDLTDLFEKFAKERGHTYKIENLIDDLINNISILTYNDRGLIQFKHLSFQEYFCAYQIYNHSKDNSKYFIENFNDIWWQNVAIFYAGMTKDSPELLDKIIENTEPKNFREYLINLSGLGFLLQALYNTPIEYRIKGIQRNLNTILNAIKFIQETDEEEYEIFKVMFYTKFGLYKIISHWFNLHHTSITLHKPLEEIFEGIIQKISSEEVSESDKKDLEYLCFVLAETLSGIKAFDPSYLKQAFSANDPKNKLVYGLIDSAFHEQYKQLSKEERNDKSVKKFKGKLDLIEGMAIHKEVNIRLLDGKVIPPKMK